MSKKISITLNIFFITLFLFGMTIFVHSTFEVKPPAKPYVEDTYEGTKDTVYIHYQAAPSQKANWEGILAAMISITSLGIKVYYEQKKKNKDTVKYDNINHPVFNIIEELETNELRNLNLGTVGRSQVFKLILQIQITSYKDGLRNFISKNFTDSTDFRSKARMMVLRIVEDYEQKWKNSGVPEVVISRYTLLQQDRIKLLLADIDTLAFYTLTDDTVDFSEVIFYLLTHVSVILRLSMAHDTLQTLQELNGTLKTVTYNGYLL